jgi:transcriptional regulator with XRE-family HTH domain
MANITFGERMRRARIRNAWSQSELGEKLGVSQMTISNWENEKVVPDRSQKLRAREALGLMKADRRSKNKQTEDASAPDQDPGPPAFGSWLNRIRLEARMSVGELAAKADVSAPAIYNIESGRIENPRAETVRRLEQALQRRLPAETKEEIREEATVEGVGEFFAFDPLDTDDWPDVPGIYVLYDISERPIYVGQGASIRRRIEDHEEKFWFKAPIVVTAAYIKVAEAELRKKFETILIRFLKRNAVINKQNVDR